MAIRGRSTAPPWASARVVVLDNEGTVVGFARAVHGLDDGTGEIMFGLMSSELRAWVSSWRVEETVTFHVRDNRTNRCFTVQGAFWTRSSRPDDLSCARVTEEADPGWWPPE